MPKFECSFALTKKKGYSGKESGGIGVFPLVQADHAEQHMDGMQDRCLV